MKRTLMAAALILSAHAAWAGKAHEHGAARLDMAYEAGKLSFGLESPLDGVLGFERAPRSDAEKQKVEKMVATLKAAEKLFVIDPAAQCSLAKVDLTSAPLKLGAASPAGKADDGHGDIDADIEFSCKNAPAFVDVALFTSFTRMSRLDVQTATPKGQRKLVLKRGTQRIDFSR
jgi:Protein of unknown function (DUF2796)